MLTPPVKVSVIIPVYNSEEFLERAVESVFATKYPQLEVLIIEDGSADNSLEIAEGIARRATGNVRLLRHEGGVNRGAAASRNVGIEMATGQVIAFLDADDWYFPNRFESCIAMMQQDPELDVVYSKSQVVLYDDDSGHMTETEEMSLPEASTEETLFRRLLVADSCWHINSVVCRASFLKEVAGRFNEALPLGQDLELWLRASLVGTFARDQEEIPVAAYRRHSNNRYQGGFSLSCHQTCLEVYGSALRWMKNNDVARENIEMLEQWICASTFRRTDIWLDTGRRDVARRLVYLLGREYPRVLLRKRYWGNVFKAIHPGAGLR